MTRWLLRLLLAIALCCGSHVAQADAGGKPRTHTVHRGQRLGSIAKRYNVSVDALCTANGISRRDPIQPGQVLIIPAPGDRDGTAAARKHRKGKRAKSTPPPRSKPAADAPRLYEVRSGDTLGKIAHRNHVSIAALCEASGVSRRDPLRLGQRLVIPARGDKDGTRAAHLRKTGQLEREAAEQEQAKASSAAKRPKAAKAKPRRSGPSWKKYAAKPWRKGYVTLVGYQERWKGYVIGPGNRVLPGARRAVSRVLGATGKRPRVDRRLVRLIARVSDQFGGRPIYVVSGYRKTSYSTESRHQKSRAIDFHIPGVPNRALSDYLRTIPGTGVGYYPNSTFVHLDVRKTKTYWVDYAGPGEAPRYAHRGGKPGKPAPDGRKAPAAAPPAGPPQADPPPSKPKDGPPQPD